MRRILALALMSLLVLGACAGAAARRHRRPHRHHRGRTGHLITKRTWLTGVDVTEYYALPEAWYKGRRVPASGLPDAHRIDWLYSASGLVLEGDGIDLQGRPVHLATVDGHGFVDSSGHRTSSAPVWVSGGYWLTAAHALTFPLEAGGWSTGTGVSYQAPPAQLSFAPGPSRPLTAYRSLAVDPKLIPLGSRVYIPAYAGVEGASGWFVAEDTGGAITGRHVDVYRPAPPTRDGARMLSGQRILVEPPGSAKTKTPAPRGTALVGGGTVVPATISCAPNHLEVACPKN